MTHTYVEAGSNNTRNENEDIDGKNRHSCTEIMARIKNRPAENIQLQIYGDRPFYGMTILHVAIANRNTHLIRALIEYLIEKDHLGKMVWLGSKYSYFGKLFQLGKRDPELFFIPDMAPSSTNETYDVFQLHNVTSSKICPVAKVNIPRDEQDLLMVVDTVVPFLICFGFYDIAFQIITRIPERLFARDRMGNTIAHTLIWSLMWYPLEKAVEMRKAFDAELERRQGHRIWVENRCEAATMQGELVKMLRVKNKRMISAGDMIDELMKHDSDTKMIVPSVFLTRRGVV